MKKDKKNEALGAHATICCFFGVFSDSFLTA
jgi:hypothetical protein